MLTLANSPITYRRNPNSLPQCARLFSQQFQSIYFHLLPHNFQSILQPLWIPDHLPVMPYLLMYHLPFPTLLKCLENALSSPSPRSNVTSMKLWLPQEKYTLSLIATSTCMIPPLFAILCRLLANMSGSLIRVCQLMAKFCALFIINFSPHQAQE
jgi:hypothetical protein